MADTIDEQFSAEQIGLLNDLSQRNTRMNASAILHVQAQDDSARLSSLEPDLEMLFQKWASQNAFLFEVRRNPLDVSELSTTP